MSETLYLTNERAHLSPEQLMLRLDSFGLEQGIMGATTDAYGHTCRLAFPVATVSDARETYRLWLLAYLHGSEVGMRSATMLTPDEGAYASLYVASTEIKQPLLDDRAPLAIIHATSNGCTHPPIFYYEHTFVQSWVQWRSVLGHALAHRILPAILGAENRYRMLQEQHHGVDTFWATYATMGIDAT